MASSGSSSSHGPRGGNARDSGNGAGGGRAGADGAVTKVTIPTDFVASRELQKRIIDEVTGHKFHDNALFAIKLALEEAMNNAVKHGNKGDPSKSVHVEYSVTAKRAEIVVEDEGAGFVRKKVPDPTKGENLIKCSGRGLLLIEAYMNKVEYSNGGRRVRMIKNNEPHALAKKSQK